MTGVKENLDLGAVSQWPEDDLRRALIVVQAELQRRAVERADPAALVERGFADGFQTSGLPRDPWIVNGILVAPGAKIDKSAMSHRCAFVRIGSSWIWEQDDLLEDSVRHLPGARGRMQSVSLLPIGEGVAVDLVEARTRNGVHELVGVRSFTVENGELQLVSARAVNRVSHR